MFYKIKKFFKIRRTFTFVLKSGKEIKFKAIDLRITSIGNQLQSYTIIGGTDKMFYVKIDEIAAILQ